MKKIVGMCLSVLLWAVAGCESDISENGSVSTDSTGMLKVNVRCGNLESRALVDYQDATEEEIEMHRVDVMVFDKSSGRLEMSASMSGEHQCSMSVIEGKKVIYAIVNGPDLTGVTSIDKLMLVKNNMTLCSMDSDGLMMTGYAECTVIPDEVVEPTIVVQWLAARVVLGRLECGIAKQFEEMTLDCVYLGNANVSQTIGGTVGDMVNIDGRADATIAPDYLYRPLNKTIDIDGVYEEGCCLYCQPNQKTPYTCLYIRVIIDGAPYYYRVPLHGGLLANHTYSIEAVITNLGASEPPTEDMEKGEIVATVEVAGWMPGDSYVAEF